MADEDEATGVIFTTLLDNDEPDTGVIRKFPFGLLLFVVLAAAAAIGFSFTTLVFAVDELMKSEVALVNVMTCFLFSMFLMLVKLFSSAVGCSDTVVRLLDDGSLSVSLTI